MTRRLPGLLSHNPPGHWRGSGSVTFVNHATRSVRLDGAYKTGISIALVRQIGPTSRKKERAKLLERVRLHRMERME